MWCCACQQDVPALGSASGGDLRCGKCGTNLASASQTVPNSAPATSVAVRAPARAPETSRAVEVVTWAENATVEQRPPKPLLPEDDWALEAEVRDVQRLLASLKSRQLPGNDPLAFHASHSPRPASHTEFGSAGDRESEPNDQNLTVSRDDVSTVEPGRHRGHSAAWLILSPSLAVFTCGAVLLVWSLVGHRDDLWPVGLPLALIGQAGLMVGVVLQLDGLRTFAVSATRGTESQKLLRRKRRRARAG